MNSYELMRPFWDWAYDNPEKIKPVHIAVFHFAIEHCNRMGWKQKFGFPSQMTMEAIGVKSYKTYISALTDLVDWGFIKMIERSKNQYSANIIELVKYTKASTKALDKALPKHGLKQPQSTGESIDSIDKPLNNKTIKPITNKQVSILLCSLSDETELTENENITFSFWKLFKKNLLESGITKPSQLNKAKLKSWTSHIRLMIDNDGRTMDEMKKVWGYLDSKESDFWKPNIQSTKKLREKFERLYMEASKVNSKSTGKITQSYIQELENRLYG